MKNLTIFSLKLFFFIKVFLKNVKQSNYSSFDIFLIIIDLKIVIKAFLCLINLIKAQFFYIHKLTKVFMDYENKNLKFVVF